MARYSDGDTCIWGYVDKAKLVTEWSCGERVVDVRKELEPYVFTGLWAYVSDNHTGIDVFGTECVLRQRSVGKPESVAGAEVDNQILEAGWQCLGRWNATGDWVWSAKEAHIALVPQETFDQAQAIVTSKMRTNAPRKPRATPRVYALNGRLICKLCDRRLHGSWNHDKAYYRCSYAKEYAASRNIDHPKAVYLRESDFIGQLDRWLVEVFDANNLEMLSQQIASADDRGDDKKVEIAILEHKATECRTKLARYREALETGTEISLVMGWIAEATAALSIAEGKLHELRAKPAEALTEENVRGTLDELGGLVGVLESGIPDQRSEFYEALGLRAVYDPTERTVDVSLDTRVRMVRVGEPTRTIRTRVLRRLFVL